MNDAGPDAATQALAQITSIPEVTIAFLFYATREYRVLRAFSITRKSARRRAQTMTPASSLAALRSVFHLERRRAPRRAGRDAVGSRVITHPHDEPWSALGRRRTRRGRRHRRVLRVNTCCPTRRPQTRLFIRVSSRTPRRTTPRRPVAPRRAPRRPPRRSRARPAARPRVVPEGAGARPPRTRRGR